MRHDAFQEWRREREAVEQEMDLLITAGLPASNEERQVRRTRFAALLERREAAARNLLHSDRTRRRNRSPADSSGPGDRLISAAHAGAGVEAGPATFVPLPDGRSKTDAQSELPVHVTTAASPFDAVALALDTAALPADADTASTASVAADERPSEVVALALDASPPTEFEAVAPIGLPADVAEPAAEQAALASDAPDFSPDSATVAAAGLPADAAEPATEKAALAPDVTAVLPDPATVATGGLPADAAEPATEKAALAPDVAAVLPDPATAAATGLPADAAEPATEKAALASDATDFSPDSATAAAAGLPADAAEPATEHAALASDATDVSPDSATVAAAGLAADAAEPATEKVALAPDVAAALPDPATVAAGGLAADAAEFRADVIASERDATARLPDPAVALPSAAAEPSVEAVALAPTTTDASTESAGSFTPSVAVANRSDAAPLAGDAKVQSASSSDDSHSDASLLKLLRRLKPKIGQSWQRSGG
jgi:hypothetical protein